MDNDTRNFLEGIAFDEALIKKFAEAGMIMNTFLFASADELNEICGALEVPLLKGITFKTAVRSLQATRVAQTQAKANKMGEVESESEEENTEPTTNKKVTKAKHKKKVKKLTKNAQVNRSLSRSANSDFITQLRNNNRLKHFCRLEYVHCSHVVAFMIANTDEDFTTSAFHTFLQSNQLEAYNETVGECVDCRGSPRFQMSFVVKSTYKNKHSPAYWSSHYQKEHEQIIEAMKKKESDIHAQGKLLTWRSSLLKNGIPIIVHSMDKQRVIWSLESAFQEETFTDPVIIHLRGLVDGGQDILTKLNKQREGQELKQKQKKDAKKQKKRQKRAKDKAKENPGKENTEPSNKQNRIKRKRRTQESEEDQTEEEDSEDETTSTTNTSKKRNREEEDSEDDSSEEREDDSDFTAADLSVSEQEEELNSPPKKKRKGNDGNAIRKSKRKRDKRSKKKESTKSTKRSKSSKQTNKNKPQYLDKSYQYVEFVDDACSGEGDLSKCLLFKMKSKCSKYVLPCDKCFRCAKSLYKNRKHLFCELCGNVLCHECMEITDAI
eukprot:506924_1